METSSRQLHIWPFGSEESAHGGMNLGVVASTAIGMDQITQGSVCHKGYSTLRLYQ